MIDRRTFLSAVGGGLVASSLANSAEAHERKRLAIVTTEWRYHSHAWHMGERFLVGYPIDGRDISRRLKWCRPTLISGRKTI